MVPCLAARALSPAARLGRAPQSDGGIKQGEWCNRSPSPFNSGGSNTSQPHRASSPAAVIFAGGPVSSHHSPHRPGAPPVTLHCLPPSPCRRENLFAPPSPLPLSTVTACRRRHAWRRHCSPRLDHPCVSPPRAAQAPPTHHGRPNPALSGCAAWSHSEPCQTRPDRFHQGLPSGAPPAAVTVNTSSFRVVSGRGDNVVRFRRKA